MKDPRVLGLILCKRLTVDVAAAELSLVGVLNEFRFGAWPAAAPPFSVYTTLTGGQGQGIIELMILNVETEEEIYNLRYWRGFTDPRLIIHHEMIARRCVFPTPGRYLAILRFDGRQLASRPFDVRPLGGSS
jgi:hypothetical protein